MGRCASHLKIATKLIVVKIASHTQDCVVQCVLTSQVTCIPTRKHSMVHLCWIIAPSRGIIGLLHSKNQFAKVNDLGWLIQSFRKKAFFLFDSLNCVVFMQPSTLLRCHSLTLFSGSSLTVDLFWFFPHSFSLPLSLWFVSLLRLLCLRLNALSFVLPLSSGSKVCYTMMCFVVKEKG